MAMPAAYFQFHRPFVLPARSPCFHRGGPGAAPGRATIFSGRFFTRDGRFQSIGYFSADVRTTSTKSIEQRAGLFRGSSSTGERVVANDEAAGATPAHRTISDLTHRKLCCGLLSRKGGCKSPRVHDSLLVTRKVRGQSTKLCKAGALPARASKLWGRSQLSTAPALQADQYGSVARRLHQFCPRDVGRCMAVFQTV
jgi:hypothetical protein